jgi:hypothetical protein
MQSPGDLLAPEGLALLDLQQVHGAILLRPDRVGG